MADPTYRASMLPIGTYANPDGTESLGWAVPGMIEEPLNALTRLFGSGNFAQGPDYGSNADDMRTLLFSMYGGNALNPLTALPENAVGMFAGRMAKTADHAALTRAEDLAASGAPREQILKDTGWFQGADGKWRFEIDDSNARISDRVASDFEKRDIGDRVPVENADRFLDHPELFEAYPDLWRVNTRLEKGGGYPYQPHGAYYVRESGTEGINLNAGSIGQARSLDLHEIQHAIQRRENFGAGADAHEVGMNNYVRHAGEVEANNVQRRQDMTPDERRAAPPWRTQNIPDNEQIVKFYSDTGKPSLMGSAIAAESAPQRMYHGTGVPEDFATFTPSPKGSLGPGVYLSKEADTTLPWANNGPNPRIMPVDVSGRIATYDDYLAARQASPDQAATIQALMDQGYSGAAMDVPGKSGNMNVTNVFKPGSIRSATTGETLFSDTGRPSLWGSALYQDQEPRNALLNY